MERMPAFSPELLIAYDLNAPHHDVATLAAHEARMKIFARCAQTMEDFLNDAPLLDEEYEYFEKMRHVFLYDDPSLERFASENLDYVVETLLIQHLLDHGLAEKDCELYETALADLMMDGEGKTSALFLKYVETCEDSEYVSMVFRIACNLIEDVNKKLFPNAVMYH